MSRVFRESNHESQRQARTACAAGPPTGGIFLYTSTNGNRPVSSFLTPAKWQTFLHRTGGVDSLQVPELETARFLTHRKIPPLKTIKMTRPRKTSSSGWGGRRPGAGRPLGSRNRPRLIEGLPVVDDPLQWLLSVVNHADAPPRLRVSCAKALMPYFHREHLRP